jgi:hypothetical protein
MPILVWKHGTTAAAARDSVRAELDRLGHGGKVTWAGDEASASVGWGLVLSAAGRVTDEVIVLDKCGGAVGGLVLAKCRELLARLFPGGDDG